MAEFRLVFQTAGDQGLTLDQPTISAVRCRLVWWGSWTECPVRPVPPGEDKKHVGLTCFCAHVKDPLAVRNE